MFSNGNNNGIASGNPTVALFPSTSNVITLTSYGPDRTLGGGDDVTYTVTLGALRAYFATGGYMP
jgi:hypothetical protein